MSSDYTLVLRSCPDNHRESAAVFLGKLFSLKEHTCQQITGACPIILLAGLGREEAAAVHLLAHGLELVGAQIEIHPALPAELPKIDWPRRPQVFKRELGEWVGDLQVILPLPGGGTARLLDLLLAGVEGRHGGAHPEYKGSQLPEVTPFNTPTLAAEAPYRQTRTPPPQPMRTPLPAPPLGDGAPPPGEALSRLNELFPEDDASGFLPGKEDITSLLNRILPDEQPGETTGASSAVVKTPGSGGYAVFLAKIGDEDRRKRAATLIAELAKMALPDAEALSKKMIIPVLKGVSKDEAEAAKAQFGKIGLLARVKGPE